MLESDEVIYSTLSGDKAGVHHQDVECYLPVPAEFGLQLLEPVYEDVNQLLHIGNRVKVHRAVGEGITQSRAGVALSIQNLAKTENTMPISIQCATHYQYYSVYNLIDAVQKSPTLGLEQFFALVSGLPGFEDKGRSEAERLGNYVRVSAPAC
jgi:hypothetical protein